MGVRAPLALINQIKLMVAVSIDEVTARELIGVVAYWLLHISPAKNLKPKQNVN